MTGAAVIERSPAWAGYVWFARGDRSRLYPAIEAFVQRVEIAAASVTHDLVAEFRRRRRPTMLKYGLKRIAYAMFGMRAKQDRSRGRFANERRAIRDAAITIGAGRIEHGELSEIMNRCGSDKGGGRHNYTLFYETLFGEDRQRFARVLEVGIGSNNAAMPFNMGVNGVPGASLRGWREYFPKADIFGADLDEQILFEENRIKTAAVDQTQPASIDRLFGLFGGDFDLIVDDGYHQLDANRTLFENAFPRLKAGGIYVIEDDLSRNRDAYKAFLSPYDAAILDIPYPPNCEDNCLAIVAREG